MTPLSKNGTAMMTIETPDNHKRLIGPHKTQKAEQFQSNALWPAEISGVSAHGDNISADTHDTEEQAKAVCDALEREGFGGERKVFPLKTWVSQVLAPPVLPNADHSGGPAKMVTKADQIGSPLLGPHGVRCPDEYGSIRNAIEAAVQKAMPKDEPCNLGDLQDRIIDRLTAEQKAEQQKPGYEVVADDIRPSSDPGAWTCKACGFRGFWRGGPHCVQRN